MNAVKRFKFESSSSNKIYETVQWEDGSFSCNCPGWAFKKGDLPRTCKHLKQVSAGGVGAADTPKKIATPATAPFLNAGTAAPVFFKPMVAQTYEGKKLPAGDRYAAEPKLDGQRGIVFVEKRKTVAVYSRQGNELLASKANGMGWLEEVKWPFDSATLDGEICSGGGLCIAGETASEGRSTVGLNVDLVVFDVLALAGKDWKARAWTDRRAALETAFQSFKHKRITVATVSDNPTDLWKTWVEKMGGEGIMLKDRSSIYVPGLRSPHWLKVKMEVTVDVAIVGITDKATYNGKAGYKTAEAALIYGYYNPNTKKFEDAGQGVMRGTKASLQQYIGMVAEMKCMGVMPSGALRHGQFLRWRNDKIGTECVKH